MASIANLSFIWMLVIFLISVNDSLLSQPPEEPDEAHPDAINKQPPLDEQTEDVAQSATETFPEGDDVDDNKYSNYSDSMRSGFPNNEDNGRNLPNNYDPNRNNNQNPQWAQNKDYNPNFNNRNNGQNRGNWPNSNNNNNSPNPNYGYGQNTGQNRGNWQNGYNNFEGDGYNNQNRRNGSNSSNFDPNKVRFPNEGSGQNMYPNPNPNWGNFDNGQNKGQNWGNGQNPNNGQNWGNGQNPNNGQNQGNRPNNNNYDRDQNPNRGNWQNNNNNNYPNQNFDQNQNRFPNEGNGQNRYPNPSGNEDSEVVNLGNSGTNMCGRPNANANSYHNVSRALVPAATFAIYRCDAGFHMLGDDVRTCRPDGTWTKNAPICARKVSVGKKIDCSEINYVNPNETAALVDGNDKNCARPIKGVRPTSQFVTWTLDLLEEYSSIGAYRLVFFAKHSSVPVVKIFVQSHYGKGQREVQPNECSILQREIADPSSEGFHEIIITPNARVSARYIQFNVKLRNVDDDVEFCEAEVFDTDGPAVHQCLDLNKIDDSAQSKRLLKSTVIHGQRCYTFIEQLSKWTDAMSVCSSTVGGELVYDINPDINELLKGIANANYLNGNYWIGGKAEEDVNPYQTRGSAGVVWKWANDKYIDKKLVSGENAQKSDCLVFDVKSGIWLNLPCTERLKVLCQTKIKRCSHPSSDSNVITATPYDTTVDSFIEHHCPSGFNEVVGNGKQTRRQCMANGQWNGQSPHCLGKADYAAYQAHNSKLPQEAILGIIIAAIIVGLILIAVILAIVFSRKRGGRFKEKIYFQKGQKNVKTEDTKGDSSKLTEVKKESYDSVNQSCTEGNAHQQQQSSE